MNDLSDGTTWLSASRRVLTRAEDERTPLLERLKYLARAAGNLDRFFELQIPGAPRRLKSSRGDGRPRGVRLLEERDSLLSEARHLVMEQYRCWSEQLQPMLAAQGIRLCSVPVLEARGRAFIEDYWRRQVDPLLTPITVDPAHPFPCVVNKTVCVAFLLRRRSEERGIYVGVVAVPRILPRLIRVPSAELHDYVILTDLVASHADRMYRSYKIQSSAAFRVTRHSSLSQREEWRAFLEPTGIGGHNRRKDRAVRLEIDAGAKPELVERLRSHFSLEPGQIHCIHGPLNLQCLFSLYEQVERPDLKYEQVPARQFGFSSQPYQIADKLRRQEMVLTRP